MHTGWKASAFAEIHRVVPDHQRHITGNHAGLVVERDLAVELVDDGYAEPESIDPPGKERTGREHEHPRVDSRSGREATPSTRP